MQNGGNTRIFWTAAIAVVCLPLLAAAILGNLLGFFSGPAEEGFEAPMQGPSAVSEPEVVIDPETAANAQSLHAAIMDVCATVRAADSEQARDALFGKAKAMLNRVDSPAVLGELVRINQAGRMALPAEPGHVCPSGVPTATVLHEILGMSAVFRLGDITGDESARVLVELLTTPALADDPEMSQYIAVELTTFGRTALPHLEAVPKDSDPHGHVSGLIEFLKRPEP